MKTLWPLLLGISIAFCAVAIRADEPKPFEYADGKLSIAFPGKPTESKSKDGATTKFTYSENADTALIASSTSLPKLVGASDDLINATLEGAVNGAAKAGKLQQKDEVMLGEKYPGRAYTLGLSNPAMKNGVAQGRMYIVDGMLIQGVAVGPKEWVEAPDQQKFLNSLKVVK